MKKSFTLIETIVVIAVIGLTLPVLFVIILTLMKQQVKIYRLSQIKREGDYVINVMENTIKDRAIIIYKSAVINDSNIVCNDLIVYPPNGTTVDNLYFLDKNNVWFGYKLNGTTVVSDSVNPANLTSSKIIVSNFSISCLRNTIYSAPAVLLSFDVCYYTGLPNCATTRPEEVTSIHYQTRIKLRNY